MQGDVMKMVKLIFSLFLLLLLGACATTEEELDGQTLFSTKGCSGCHGSDATGIVGKGRDIRGESAATITAAINGKVSQMSGLQGVSSAEIDAIAEYLATLQASSKLSKVSVVINGAIQNDSELSGLVVLKDSSGQLVELEVENGEFVFDSSTLQFPVLLKFVDDQGDVLFGLSDGQDQNIEISPATDEVIQQYADAEQLFDTCDEDSDACFDVLDDEEVVDAVRMEGN